MTISVARLLLSRPLTIFSMESSSLGLLAAAADGEGDDLFGEDDGSVGDGGDPLEATLSNAEPPEVPIDATAAAVGDNSGENLCRNLSATARGDDVEPAAYAEARSGFCCAARASCALRSIVGLNPREGEEGAAGD